MHRYVFKKFTNDSLKSIQLYAKDGIEYALILLHQSSFLIQYSMLSIRPKKLSLIIPSENGAYDVLIPAEIAIKGDDELVISDYSNCLWFANLKKIRHNIRNKDIELFVEVKYLGSLLGASKALTVPPVIDDETNQYLYYYLPRDGAVVRWNFR